MSRLAPARRAALRLLGNARRRKARVRDLARDDAGMRELKPADRALAMRLVMGATSAEAVLDRLVDERLRRPSSLEPRVRDALRMAAFEICYLDTPDAVAASQGVELVRSVAPRAAGLANAVLRALVTQAKPQVDAARILVARACAPESASDGERAGDVTPDTLSLASGIPAWLCERILCDRGVSAACGLCASQLEPAPVFVAANGLRHTADSLFALLADAGMEPRETSGLAGSFVLGNPGPLVGSGMVERVDLVVSDRSAQTVCRLAEAAEPGDLLEIGQGRGTKSLLLATACDAVHPARIVGVDTVPYKVRVTRRRMETAGLADVVSPLEFDACALVGENLPPVLDRVFPVVLVDAPCSGTGTMRRHPEICSSLAGSDVQGLAALQLRMLSAAASRVAAGGVLLYATCSVLREEDEAVVQAFLASDAGAGFSVEPVVQAPACQRSDALASAVSAAQTEEGFLLTTPTLGGGDGHFCARLRRV